MTDATIQLMVNGTPVSQTAEPRTHLADFLREEMLLTGTHLGCEQGVCGACTVFVDGKPTRSCITLAAACTGAEIRSVEGFDEDPLMRALRTAFKKHHGLQCGFCTPGMLVTGYDIVRRLPNADAARIRKELSGNLCRCTGYAGIIAAITDVLENAPPEASVQPHARAQQPQSSAATSLLDNQDTPSPQTAKGDASTTIPDRHSLEGSPPLSRTLTFDTPAADIWNILSDPKKIVSCIPGARLDSATQDGKLQGQCAVSMGPIKAAFVGTAKMDLKDAEKSGHVIGRGRDSLSRSQLDGMLDFHVTRSETGDTVLSLDMTYKLTGTLSQFSRPTLVAEIADRILVQVASAIEARAQGKEPDATAQTSLNGLSLLASVFKGWFRRVLWFR